MRANYSAAYVQSLIFMLCLLMKMYLYTWRSIYVEVHHSNKSFSTTFCEDEYTGQP